MMKKDEEIIRIMEGMRDEEQRSVLMRFFKTGVGQYGEGDEFLGLKVPQTRAITKQFKGQLSFPEIETLLYSRWHEVRLCGFLLLVEEMKAAKRIPERRREVVTFYLRHARQANNWDLVDLSCPYILGEYLLSAGSERDVLQRLAASDNLWEQRIAIVSTMMLIRHGEFDDTLHIAELLLDHPHDLIHKAIGWMLREVGKHDIGVLTAFLSTHYSRLPRTTLRYAIERFDPQLRHTWLTRPRADRSIARAPAFYRR